MDKSICWVDAEECLYISGLKSFKDISIKTCSQCVRFVENRELLHELFGEELGGEWLDTERLGVIYSLLEKLKKSEVKLSVEEEETLEEALHFFS
jgi:hypothetical protein